MASDSVEPSNLDPTGAFVLARLARAWRERALLTQEQLARRSGLGVRTIVRLESGGLRRPRLDSVRLLADALGLSDAERARLVSAARGDVAISVVPRQLPAEVAGFTGRVDQLRVLDGLRAGVTVAITGTAGVGKTALGRPAHGSTRSATAAGSAAVRSWPRLSQARDWALSETRPAVAL